MYRLAVVGLGRMGRPICARLVRSGFEVAATDVVAERRTDAEAAGARWGDGLEATAADADIVVTVLPGPPEVAAIAEPLTAAMTSGALWLDLSTASPPAAEAVRTAAAQRDIAVVDAPLGGSPEDAGAGRLLSFAGGDAADLERARPVLAAIAGKVVHVGPHGSGYLTKLLANALWFGQAVATAEALAIADRAGLDVARVQGALAESAAGRGFLAADAPALIAGETMPAFSFARCVEQLRSLQAAAADLNVPADVLDAVADVHGEALREYGEADGEMLGALYAARRAGVDFPAPPAPVTLERMGPEATLLMWFQLRAPDLADDFEALMAGDRDIVRSSLDTVSNWHLMRPADVPGQAIDEADYVLIAQVTGIDRFEEQASEHIQRLTDDLDHLVAGRGMLILRSVL